MTQVSAKTDFNIAKPDPNIGARAERNLRNGPEIASSIKTLGPTAGAARENDSPVTESWTRSTELNGKLTNTQVALKAVTEKELKQISLQKDKAQQYAQSQYRQAGLAAQAVALNLIANIVGEDSLEYLKDRQDHKETTEQASEQKESFETRLAKLSENPDQIPFIMRNLVSAKIAEDKKQAQETGDKEKEEKLTQLESSLNPVFGALGALENNGSHQELFAVLQNLSSEELSSHPALKGLINNYRDKLFNIAQAQKRYVGITQQLEKNFLNVAGVDQRTDKAEFKRLYARLGGSIADRNGGITGLGKIFNYQEADVVHSGAPYEWKPDASGLSTASFPVQRLLWEALTPSANRTYTSVALSEDHPVPRYVIDESRAQGPMDQIPVDV